MASLESKVNFVKKYVNINLKKEKSFPLLLHYNYHLEIKPRVSLLRKKTT
jgi:hypothetical protein